jgi:hypothetical protein
MLDLLSDGETRLRIGAANRQRAPINSALDRMVRSYNALYQSCIVLTMD